ncbi:hypothetical protein [Natrinema versiforme]|uniref:Uncharacterized protein n=1 Tax=Natrinema versiforme JCM 10478 TaxID=1227496 RepID=L9Y7B4_9EURY|nr:hypothetical protein [Natrinema versiforme]ELY68828.1 hypothetical protein C489_05663 [Natrinema versiforme JCM 10478]
MNLAQWITAVLVIVVLGVSLLNPGGWIIALLIVVAILLFYAGIEFIPEYLLVTNQGKNARKDKRRKRRSRGLNPFSRSSKRESNSHQSQTQTEGGRDE